MPQLFFGHVMNGDVRIHYYRTGDIKPPVVMLHGLTDNGLCWGRLAYALEPDYDLVLVDLRGHGISAAPEHGYDIQSMASDIHTVMTRLELGKVAIIGHSLGAALAGVVARNYPELVAGVVLEDPPWGLADLDPDGVGIQYRRTQMLDSMEKWSKQNLDEVIELGRQRHPDWTEDDLFQWAKAKKQVKPTVAELICIDWTIWDNVVHSLHCPGLLLTADPEKGGLVTPELAGRISKSWKNVNHLRIHESGHSIRRDQYDCYLGAVRQFLAKLKRKKQMFA